MRTRRSARVTIPGFFKYGTVFATGILKGRKGRPFRVIHESSSIHGDDPHKYGAFHSVILQFTDKPDVEYQGGPDTDHKRVELRVLDPRQRAKMPYLEPVKVSPTRRNVWSIYFEKGQAKGLPGPVAKDIIRGLADFHGVRRVSVKFDGKGNYIGIASAPKSRKAT